MSPAELHARLLELAEPAYREFSARLLPPGTALLGVRLPALRRLARRLAAEPDWRANFDAPANCLEEDLIRGFLPGYAPGISLEERLELIARIVPTWRNWSVCDSCCATYGFVRSDRERVWDWLRTSLADTREYVARFGVVMLLMHYSREAAWLPRLMAILPRVPTGARYADLAVAWCACELALLHPDARRLLRPGVLPEATRRLALRKLRESRRGWHGNKKRGAGDAFPAKGCGGE